MVSPLPDPDAETWEYFRRNAGIHYDPAAWLAQVRCPVLAIFGAADLLLPVDRSFAVYCHGLAQAGNADVTINVFPGAGHLITLSKGDELAPGYLELLAQWLTQRFERAPRA